MHMRDDYIGQPYEASLCLSRSGSVGPTAVTVYYVIQFEGFVERVLTKQEETLAQSSAAQSVCKGHDSVIESSACDNIPQHKFKLQNVFVKSVKCSEECFLNAMQCFQMHSS